MASTKTPKRTTLADLMAAAALGTIDPSTEVSLTTDMVPSDDIERRERELSARIAQHDASARRLPLSDSERAMAATALSAVEHECGIPGCRHGSAHPAVSQPDRQVKLQCPGCGAVARMTAGALNRALGITCHADGSAFVPAARRTYVRKSA